MAEKKSQKKHGRYTRREALKYAGKISAGAAIWGTVGNFSGQTYESVRDTYRRDVRPYVEKGKALIDNAGEAAENVGKATKAVKETVWDNPIKYWGKKIRQLRGMEKETSPPEEIKTKPPKKDYEEKPASPQRRTLFKKLLGYAHENPVIAGTVAGGVYGGIKKTISGSGEYQQNTALANLRETVKRLEEKLDKTLEGKTISTLAILVGIFGLAIAFAMFEKTITGFSISGNFINNLSILPGILMILSAILILVGIIRREK